MSSPGRARPRLLRELSEQAILETIFREGPITRPEIAARTNISKPTVSAVVQRLVQAHLVEPTGERPGRRGRTPIAFTVNSTAGFVLGLDLGSTMLRIAAADLYGEVLREVALATTTGGARAVDGQITSALREIVDAIRPSHGDLLALGVSTPGVVDPATRRVTSLAYQLSASGRFDFLATLEDRFGVPVLVDNDVNLAAVGEKWRGLAAGVPTFLFVTIGAGVGMGIVIDDELFRGAHGAAGEIGYLPLTRDPFGEQHRRLGGLEDEIGAAGIVSAYNAALGAGGSRVASARDVLERARIGEPTARAVVELTAKRIGLAIATVSAVIDPELVILGGRIGARLSCCPACARRSGSCCRCRCGSRPARSPSALRSRARSRWGCARRASGCSRRSGARRSSGQAPRKRRVGGGRGLLHGLRERRRLAARARPDAGLQAGLAARAQQFGPGLVALVPAPLRPRLAEVHRPVTRHLAAARYRRRYAEPFMSDIDYDDDLLQYSLDVAAPRPALRYHDAVRMYFQGGEWNAAEMAEVVGANGFPLADARSVLEFACGWGRVTRHLVHRMDRRRLTVSDIDPVAVQFVCRKLGVAFGFASSGAQAAADHRADGRGVLAQDAAAAPAALQLEVGHQLERAPERLDVALGDLGDEPVGGERRHPQALLDLGGGPARGERLGDRQRVAQPARPSRRAGRAGARPAGAARAARASRSARRRPPARPRASTSCARPSSRTTASTSSTPIRAPAPCSSASFSSSRRRRCWRSPTWAISARAACSSSSTPSSPPGRRASAAGRGA